eukprot:4441982-Lingulodinium_polyedra.AAC.1
MSALACQTLKAQITPRECIVLRARQAEPIHNPCRRFIIPRPLSSTQESHSPDSIERQARDLPVARGLSGLTAAQGVCRPLRHPLPRAGVCRARRGACAPFWHPPAIRTPSQ